MRLDRQELTIEQRLWWSRLTVRVRGSHGNVLCKELAQFDLHSKIIPLAAMWMIIWREIAESLLR